MAVISMQKITSIVSQITTDNQGIQFRSGEFKWSPTKKTIYHPEIENLHDLFQLLHELSHAKLGHKEYKSDATLIDMERDAWQYAVDTLAPKYQLQLTMDDDIVQDSLDSYRDWLNSRSTCPHCGAVGLQSGKQSYRCLVCHGSWRVNDARSCQLKRYKK